MSESEMLKKVNATLKNRAVEKPVARGKGLLDPARLREHAANSRPAYTRKDREQA